MAPTTDLTRDEKIAWLRDQAAILRRQADIDEASGAEPREVNALRSRAQWVDNCADAATTPRVSVLRGARGGVSWTSMVVVFPDDTDIDAELVYRPVGCCHRHHATPSAAEKCGRRRLEREEVA